MRVHTLGIAEGLQALADSPRMASLTRLTLNGYLDAPEGVEALLVSGHLTGLAHLDLSYHRIRTLRPAVLASATHGTALRRLWLRDGLLEDNGVRALAGCPRLAGLRELTLDGNPLGTEGNGDYEQGETYADAGLDGVMGTCQIGQTPGGGVGGCYDWGEGNGTWDLSPNVQRWYDSDLMYRLSKLIADRLVYAKVKERLGGRLRLAISGGAPLSQEIAEFFHAIDILLIEGYGLTECTTAASTNTHEDYRFGTVGRALPGFEAKLADDGELLVRSEGGDGPVLVTQQIDEAVSSQLPILFSELRNLGHDADTWFDRAGNFHSEQMQLTERYALVDRDTINYEVTVVDPKVFTRPWKMSMPLYRRLEQNAQLMEFNCIPFVEDLIYGHLRKQPRN